MANELERNREYRTIVCPGSYSDPKNWPQTEEIPLHGDPSERPYCYGQSLPSACLSSLLRSRLSLRGRGFLVEHFRTSIWGLGGLATLRLVGDVDFVRSRR